MRDSYKQIPGGMCDFHDYYQRIAQWLPNYCRVVEVGVADGHSAIYLAELLEDMGKHYELVMVDSMDYGKAEQLTTISTNVIRSGCTGIRVLPLDSLNASCKFPDGWAHFVFIDASHEYEPTKADIRLWYRKVIDGGILSGHDYHSPGVKPAVDEVLPFAQVIATEKEYGIWTITKEHNQQIC